MVKKKKGVSPPRLSPKQYWEWRTTISEMDVAKLQMEVQEKEVLTRQQDLVIRQYQLRDARDLFKKTASNYKNKKEEYHKFTSSLEQKLNCSFKGKVVDPISYEVFDNVDSLALAREDKGAKGLNNG